MAIENRIKGDIFSVKAPDAILLASEYTKITGKVYLLNIFCLKL
jgi:hypothetical protein